MIKQTPKLILIIIFTLLVNACSESPSLKPLADDAVILAFGDSLTYGTGVNSKTESYPVKLAELTGLTVINRGVPGEVSELGLERLTDALQKTQPDLVILCHGGNDLIRKLNPEQLKKNLDAMITLIQTSGAEVVLIGVPRFNLTLQVPELYSELATKHAIPIELTILPQIERDSTLKSDHVHPNARGYALMAETIYQKLKTSNGLE